MNYGFVFLAMDLQLLIEEQDYQGILQFDSTDQEIITCKVNEI